MARTGQSVCLLERGEEKWPGEYPTCLKEALKQVHFSGNVDRAFSSEWQVDSGNPNGMYHVIAGGGQSAVVGNGLGGTSLINANVFLEADPATLSMDVWPPEIRENPDCLKEYYQKVRDVLEPEPYPDTWPRLKKADLFQQQAEELGLNDEKHFYKVPQTTRFRSGPNSCGVHMSSSTLTGQDATGINDGSKTTTLVTYLADAWNWGAEMFCQCEVRYVRKLEADPGGYLVYFVWHKPGRNECEDQDLLWVHAKNAVFLGAGSIGTTEILLRSKNMGLSLSDDVGQGVTGNGDMLAFGYNTDREVNAIGKPGKDNSDPVGPTITSVIDMRRESRNPLSGFVIQDGAVPHALSRLLQPVLDHQTSSQDSKQPLHRHVTKAASRWQSRLLGPYVPSGAMERTQVFLVMSHDSSQGVVELENGQLTLEFQAGGGSQRVKTVRSMLTTAIEGIGGTPVYDPCHKSISNYEITVHPLGGARMSYDNTAAHGATNHFGEVFSGPRNSKTHSGLIVVDGAAVPTSLGVNPLATISALAERAVSEYARVNGLEISQEKNGILNLHGDPTRAHPRNVNTAALPNAIQSLPYKGFGLLRVLTETTRKIIGSQSGHNGISFGECMSGFIQSRSRLKSDDRSGFEDAFRCAKSQGNDAQLRVSVIADAISTEDSRTASRYRGVLTGTFNCPGVEGSPFMVSAGRFELFQPQDQVTGRMTITYDFDMTGIDGRQVHFHGYKALDSSVTFSPIQLWRSLTTLYVKITERQKQASNGTVNHDDDQDSDDELPQYPHQAAFEDSDGHDDHIVAAGILHIDLYNFKQGLMSLSSAGPSFLARAVKVVKYMSTFAYEPLPYLLLPLQSLQYSVLGTKKEFLNPTPPTETYNIVAKDGVKTILHMWEPEAGKVAINGHGAPRQVENVFMIPGASVDHQIYALPTIPINAVNYLTGAGYRVFVTVHRIGIVETAETGNWTTYDARLDILACFEYIRKVWSKKKLYTVAHCMGSVAFACGLLDGTIPSDWVLGVTCSQVFMNPVWSTSNVIKKLAPIALDTVYRRLAGRWFDCRDSPSSGIIQNAINQLLRFYPDQKKEKCRSAACHRTTFLFGRCWNHNNFNEGTHKHIDKFFNGANMTLMHLLMRMSGAVTGNAPGYEDLTTDENIERLRGIPFFLFSGEDNDVLSPAATEKTYATLCHKFGRSAGIDGGGIQYRRKVINGYGHLDCWMGRNAWRDVYPLVCAEIDRVVRYDSASRSLELDSE
ncbi:hypothetical protein QQS21_002613 [Conoideocrella luteorostrata]|uniref:Cholesterol oxidase n=1 Tax=Conoideocrella luteorostrata TaxID=1105319 RepID=A0AAJ0G156_9HYPO|nr:hypothetical protein QQS21_002613 [Conoideocrella luteorostrata]